jgi:ATP-binding cassette subfamily B protein
MLLLGLTCTLGFVLTMPALAYLIEWVARSIGAGDLGQLRMLALIGVVFFLVRGAFQYGQDTLMARASLQMVLELRQQIYAHLQALDVDYFSGSRTGDLVYRLTGIWIGWERWCNDFSIASSPACSPSWRWWPTCSISTAFSP